MLGAKGLIFSKHFLLGNHLNSHVYLSVFNDDNFLNLGVLQQKPVVPWVNFKGVKIDFCSEYHLDRFIKNIFP